MPSRYINLYTDFGFKKLFGEEANKDLLIDFLNAVLPEKNRFAQLSFRNSEQLPDNIDYETDRLIAGRGVSVVNNPAQPLR